jgi:AcrR family transcriptional regulator
MRLQSRERILKAAMELFVQKGYHDTTTREITERAGLSKGLLYNYFPSKEAILGGIIEARTINLAAVIAQCTVEGDAAATIGRFVQAYFAMLRRDRDYLRFRTALVLQPGIPTEVTDMIADRVEQLFQAIVGMLREVGIAAPEELTYTLMAKLDGVGLHYLGVLRAYPLDEMERKIIQEYVQKYT